MAVAEVIFEDLPGSSQASNGSLVKPKRPPTVTPKRFTRFFTPRDSLHGSRKSKKHLGRANRQLRDITRNAVNQQHSPRRSPRKGVVDDDALCTPHRTKRRKVAVVDSSPLQLQSSPCNRHAAYYDPLEVCLEEDAATIIDGDLDSICDGVARLPSPIERVQPSNTSFGLMRRTFGGRSTLRRGLRREPCVDWQHSTAGFCSAPEDVYDFRSTAIPFCTAPCNSNSLVAMGDEAGNVVLVDSSKTAATEFAQPHVKFRPHGNAIFDLAFSSDDFLLASASGDQSARVVDMRTQQVRFVMTGHISSVKQVRFQPGNDSILATSSRDGSVQIWDLRCRGQSVPAREILAHVGDDQFTYLPHTLQTVYADTCIAIREAHSNVPQPPGPHIYGTDLFTAPAQGITRRSDVSITAISFLPTGREHLLLSASEANGSIKLWDIRGKYASRRNGAATPVSSIPAPSSHSRTRPTGLSTLVLSGNGSRLYSLCKDHTVYAYSTNHLILGQAPELDASKSRWRASPDSKAGLGPMYGFRHDRLKVSSFYIKMALRAAHDDRDEMLAVGSRDGIVLFPTDEGHFRKETVEHEEDEDEIDLPRTPRKYRASYREKEDIPIYSKGTALIRGHRKEVTGVCFSSEGDLVSVSDDWTARCWREDPMKARQLRMGGEGEGQRWNCGWADVEKDFDEDE